ncbi:MAG: sulfite exporter TauE/SafE family protein [Synergistaceae bacterium]|jgi:sulfite exporter TauE/SafE/copper chaperone CopZ|nr:sulfite exporter TauE/SafE family protein [Synergistaceae bacterium]
METQRRTEILGIKGMTCVNCQNRIEKKLRAAKGVISADASYAKGTVRVVYDSNTSLDAIVSEIEGLGYKAVRQGEKGIGQSERNNIIGVLLLILALYLFLSGPGGGFLGDLSNFFPQAEAGMGYWVLFTVGLLTSVHCIAMCGGINLSQSLSTRGDDQREKRAPLLFASLRPVILYNSGRVISYTLAGGIVGALGSAVSFSGAMKGAVQIIAGIFMVILGLNMLGMFGFLRALTPRLPGFAVRLADRKKRGKGPFFVGLLNGLMPCGPLQAMQIYALSAGGPLEGALAMLSFSLGTVPLMFGLGAFSSIMSRRFAGRVMKAGAALVILMGVVMFSNGTALSGLDAGFGGNEAPGAAQSAVTGGSVSGGLQEIKTPLTRRGYPAITVKAGTPVRWNLYAEAGSINGCNGAIVIPEYNIEKRLQVGDNIIEFTPARAGKFRYSCWMGMIRGTITVVEGAAADAQGNVSRGVAAAEAADLDGSGEENASAAPGCPCCK